MKIWIENADVLYFIFSVVDIEESVVCDISYPVVWVLQHDIRTTQTFREFISDIMKYLLEEDTEE